MKKINEIQAEQERQANHKALIKTHRRKRKRKTNNMTNGMRLDKRKLQITKLQIEEKSTKLMNNRVQRKSLCVQHKE